MHDEAVMTKFWLCGFAIVVGVGACGPTYTMTDDIDLTWDFTLVPRRFEDNLHTPYVRGTKVTVFAHSSDEGHSFAGWTVVSSDPEVFRVDDNALETDGRALASHGQAVGEGTAELRLLDSRGREVGSGLAEVVVPDRVEIAAHGSLILGREDEAPVTEARVVAQGEATFLVRYVRGNRELHGNGVLSVAAPAGVTPEARTSFLFENREWLTLHTSGPETGTLAVAADGVKVAELPIVVLPETAIADVVLLTQSEKGHVDGDWLVTLAQAYDGNGERVFGVDYAWNVNGVAQEGDGDLYRYQFKKGEFAMVQARRGTHTDSVMIQSEGGRVDSTNNIGCAAGGGGSLAVGLAGLGAVALGRRRRRRGAGQNCCDTRV
jgi:MYXO-CTERM domain-containing protein